MPWTRRDLLAAGLSLPFWPTLARARQTASGYLSGARAADGGYQLVLLGENGDILARHGLPDRAHACVAHPFRNEYLAVARRPGRFLLCARDGREPQVVNSAEDRHFYGHAVYSPDGRWLYTTENDYANARGVIGIRDSDDHYRQVGEWQSGGVGPHELHLMPNGRQLLIAHGGIETHPDTGRAKRNPAAMQPSLTLLNLETGRVDGEWRFSESLNQLSIRHLDVNAAGTAVIAMQYKGPKTDNVPLIATWRPDAGMAVVEMPQPVLHGMRHYCGSAAFDTSGRLAAISTPRGGYVVVVDVQQGRFLGKADLADVCGIAACKTPGAWMLTSGRGDVRRLDVGPSSVRLTPLAHHAAVALDNHLAGLA